jgi:hypothetical protein
MSRNPIPWTSSKKEIYDAYKNVLDKYQDLIDSPLPETAKERLKEKAQETLTKVQGWTPESLKSSLDGFRDEFLGMIGHLTAKVVDEASKLGSLQEARELATKGLEKAEDLKIGSIAAEQWFADHEREKVRLLASLAENKAELESEISKIRQDWKDEKFKEEAQAKERTLQVKVLRQREEEEYEYERDKARKIASDEAQRLRTELEFELREKREKTQSDLGQIRSELSERKTRYEELEALAQNWETTLEVETTKTRKETEARLKATFDHEIALATTRFEAQKQIAETRIASLESYIAKQDQRIDDLSTKLEDMTCRVHEIANKAVEGASGGAAFKAVNRIALQQATRSEGRLESRGDNKRREIED